MIKSSAIDSKPYFSSGWTNKNKQQNLSSAAKQYRASFQLTNINTVTNAKPSNVGGKLLSLSFGVKSLPYFVILQYQNGTKYELWRNQH
jgi:hypothetical protein